MTRDCYIRPYEVSDIPFMVDSVCKYVPELPAYKNITVSSVRVEYILKHNHGNASHFQSWVLIDKKTNQLVGGSAGFCVPGMLTLDLVSNDVFLFILPEWRTLRHCCSLIVAYTQWAKARGCKLIMANQTSGYRIEALSAVMRRMGFEEVGKQFMLRMG
jgi:hypothetical protein